MSSKSNICECCGRKKSAIKCDKCGYEEEYKVVYDKDGDSRLTLFSDWFEIAEHDPCKIRKFREGSITHEEMPCMEISGDFCSFDCLKTYLGKLEFVETKQEETEYETNREVTA